MFNYRKKVEDHIGRKLTQDEVIHHKDGDSHNNDITNLEIVSRSEHGTKKHLTNEDWREAIENMLARNLTLSLRDVDEQLTLFFTDRQKQILFRRLHGMELSKTEGEYYSRKVKKKLTAIGDPSFHNAARMMLSI